MRGEGTGSDSIRFDYASQIHKVWLLFTPLMDIFCSDIDVMLVLMLKLSGVECELCVRGYTAALYADLDDLYPRAVFGVSLDVMLH